ncbi:MAG TPA: molybdenum cofactor cytidylyltransferase [Acidobacteriaceae bacterium]|nr:molybdenum cofactor cytidylyltransferase [Acidobacteriaceae bacterium]
MSTDDKMSVSSGVGAVVLAAGRSKRMGETKQLLQVKGRTLLEQALANVRASAVNAIVLVLGHEAEKIQRELPPELLRGAKIAINKDYAEGMSGSLRVGLAALEQEMDAALIVLADQPFVKPETMNLIIHAYKQGGAKLVVPHYKGKRGNPVLLDRTVFAEAMRLTGDTGFRTLFSGHAERLLPVDVEDEGVVLDIDSREDYKRLRNRSGA